LDVHQVKFGCDYDWENFRWVGSFVHLIPKVITYAAVYKTTVVLLNDHISIFSSIESYYPGNKKICEITNGILVSLGERKPTNHFASAVVNNGNKNVNLLEDIMDNNSKNTSDEFAFSGLEIRSKNPPVPNTTISKTNGFDFIKAKNVNGENQSSPQIHNSKPSSNNDLLNLFGDTNVAANVKNDVQAQKTDDKKKQGFSFIKTNKDTQPQTPQSDDLNNVFQDLNVMSKNSDKNDHNNITKTLKETLSNKLDLDKLYSENNKNDAFIHKVPSNFDQANNSGHNPQFAQHLYNNNQNMPMMNINYHQNYNLSLSDFNNPSNIKIENYVPLDMKDFNNHLPQEKIQTNNSEPPKKEEKDHFDFVNDLFKKKK